MKVTNGPMPHPVLQRMPQYLWYVKEQIAQGAEFASSQELAYALGLTSSCVRQDFRHLKLTGISKRGYEVADLDRVLSVLLGVNVSKPVLIVGAGNLGRALAMHGGLRRYGFNVCAIFDSDPALKGQRVGRLSVQGMRNLVRVVEAKNINIGVIAVPADSAQHVADRLVLAGVRRVLNLALTRVVVPKRVRLVDSRIVSSLMVLSALSMGGE